MNLAELRDYAERRFVDAETVPESESPRYRRYRDIALAAAEPFEDYWQRHPERWRTSWLRTGS
ncbi:MAG: hypothetical protein ACRDN9_11715 [Streptosporangiaceae bacterium]